MADDEKKPVQSLPPPTEEVDGEWGSSGAASAEPQEKPASTKAKSESSSQAKSASKAKAASSTAKSKRREEEDEDDDDDDDLDDDLDDEEEDEDDDDEDDRPKPSAKTKSGGHPPSRKIAKPSAASSSGDWLPDWAPWATLGALLLLGFLGGLGVLPLDFNLKQSEAAKEPTATVTAAAAPTPTTSGKPKRTREPREPATGEAANEERVAASHLLVSYKGALRAQPSVTRTKEEALKRAQQAQKRAKKGDEFEKLVAEYSDEPGAAARGGKLGKFTRRAMVPEFSDAAFAMKAGEISNVVETKFGYHVIKRTE